MPRLLLVIAVTIAALALLAIPAFAAEVVLDADGAQPRRLRVDPGEPVVWTNTRDDAVTLQGRGAPWSSGPIAPGATFSLAFDEPGTYRYASVDGSVAGRIVVGGAAPATGGGGGGSGGGGPVRRIGRDGRLAETGPERSRGVAIAGALLAAGGAALLASERPLVRARRRRTAG